MPTTGDHPAPPPPHYLTTPTSLLQTLDPFFTVLFHTLAYHRGLYPATTFLATRAYALAVRQSRHPAVCAWIAAAVAAVVAEIARGTVAAVVFAIFDPADVHAAVLERWVFDVSRLPVWAKGEALVSWGVAGAGADAGPGAQGGVPKGGDREREAASDAAETPDPRPSDPRIEGVNRVDLDQQLRAVVARTIATAEKLGALPSECTFTVCIELKDGAEAASEAASGLGQGGARAGGVEGIEKPIAHPQVWIPSVPAMQVRDGDGAGGAGGGGGGMARDGGAGRDHFTDDDDDDDERQQQQSRRRRRSQSSPPPRPRQGRDRGGVRVTPVRAVEAGVFIMEAWVEEGRAKVDWEKGRAGGGGGGEGAAAAVAAEKRGGSRRGGDEGATGKESRRATLVNDDNDDDEATEMDTRTHKAEAQELETPVESSGGYGTGDGSL